MQITKIIPVLAAVWAAGHISTEHRWGPTSVGSGESGARMGTLINHFHPQHRLPLSGESTVEDAMRNRGAGMSWRAGPAPYPYPSAATIPRPLSQRQLTLGGENQAPVWQMDWLPNTSPIV